MLAGQLQTTELGSRTTPLLLHTEQRLSGWKHSDGCPPERPWSLCLPAVCAALSLPRAPAAATPCCPNRGFWFPPEPVHTAHQPTAYWTLPPTGPRGTSSFMSCLHSSLFFLLKPSPRLSSLSPFRPPCLLLGLFQQPPQAPALSHCSSCRHLFLKRGSETSPLVCAATRTHTRLLYEPYAIPSVCVCMVRMLNMRSILTDF